VQTVAINMMFALIIYQIHRIFINQNQYGQAGKMRKVINIFWIVLLVFCLKLSVLGKYLYLCYHYACGKIIIYIVHDQHDNILAPSLQLLNRT
jgi:hypothetical protein